MNQLVESVRNLFKPIMPEVVLPVVPPKTPKPRPPKPGILLPGMDEYEPLPKSEVDSAWKDAKKYGLYNSPSSASAHYPPLTMVCSTAGDYYPTSTDTTKDYILPIRESYKWTCEGCGTVMLEDDAPGKCESCGMPREF